MSKYLGSAIVFFFTLTGVLLGLLAPPPYTQRACLAGAFIAYTLAIAYRYTLGDKRNSKLLLAYNFLRRSCILLCLFTFILPGLSLIAFFKGRHEEATVSAILAAVAVSLFALSFFALRSLTAKYGRRPDAVRAIFINYRASDATTKKIVALLMQPQLDGDGRAHVETILTEAGALAGFASQVAVWKLAPATLMHVKSKNDELYLFGHVLNAFLLEAYSPNAPTVWKIVHGAMQSPGRSAERDMKDLIHHVVNSIGSSSFGVPRLPPEHMPHKLPRELLNENWGRVRSVLVDENRKPEDWPFDLATAAYSIIVLHKDVLAPALAAKIIMEAAVPMSRVYPRAITSPLNMMPISMMPS